MKKIFVLMLVSMIAVVSAFAEVFPNAENLVENFWNHGNFIKVVKDSKNIAYYNKAQISSLRVDEDDMELSTLGYDVFTGKNNSSASFNVRSWNMESDENGNIIISRRKK